MALTTSGGTVPRTDLLIPVQDLDHQIHRLQGRIDAFPRALAATQDKLTKVQGVLEALKGEIKALKLEASKRELNVKEFDDKINKLSTQMNMAKKNDEYQAFQKEISGQKADKQRVEEGLLDFMYQLEEKAKLEKVREGEVKVAEGEHEAAKKKIEAEVALLTTELAGLRSRRAEALAGVDKELLTAYERVQKAKKDGVALAPAIRSQSIEEKGLVVYWVCGGCDMGVTSQDVNELKRGKDLVKCRSCSRLLYWKEEPQAKA